MSSTKIIPTRINLIQLKKSLRLAEAGYGILERKRDVLTRELRHMIYDAEETRGELNRAFAKAFENLRQASIELGSEHIENIALASSSKTNFILDYKSIMGVAVPIMKLQMEKNAKPDYGFLDTNASLDRAFRMFNDILEIITQLAQIEGAIFQIEKDIQKTQKRVNALKYSIIPKYKQNIKNIQFVLEEKEREDFVRVKMVKRIILGER